MNRRLLLAALGIVLLGCGGDGGGVITPPATTAVAKPATNNGDAQNGPVGQALGSPLQVLVTQDGTPTADITVSWSTAVGGGSLVPASGVTGANGIAMSGWTLGTVPGNQTAQAMVSGATGSPVSFTAQAAPGPAAVLANAGGDQQTGYVNEQLVAPVVAKAEDQFGNPVPGVGVGWEAVGATVSSGVVPTDAAGISQVQVTLGPTGGPVTITATAVGPLPLTFTATAQSPPSSLPTEAEVQVVSSAGLFFRSARNGTENPAVDTVAVGGTVTWSWIQLGTHTVFSVGTPSFTSSSVMVNKGSFYAVTFGSAGTYEYNCSYHPFRMTGRIVVR